MHNMNKVKMLDFPQNGDERGHLVVVEGNQTIPFEIKRCFYIYGSDKDVIRGHGYALQAMKDIIRIGFERYGLDEIYWNVLKKNTAAIRLYEKGGYEQMTAVSKRRADRAPDDVFFYHIKKTGKENSNYYSE